MNKTKKGFLRAATILTIVIASFSIICSFIFFGLSSKINDEFFIKDYRDNNMYTYVEESDGGYTITYEEDGEVIQVTDEDIAVSVVVLKILVCVFAFGILGYAAAMMTLAILILLGLNKGKYKKGCSIALLILAILNQTILVSVFLIVVLAIEDKKETIEIKGDEQIKLEDIK